MSETLTAFLRQTLESTRATLRGLQREVEHHTDLTPEIDALTEAITRLDGEADPACDCSAAWREWEIQVESNRVLAERVERLMSLAAWRNLGRN